MPVAFVISSLRRKRPWVAKLRSSTSWRFRAAISDRCRPPQHQDSTVPYPATAGIAPAQHCLERVAGDGMPRLAPTGQGGGAAGAQTGGGDQRRLKGQGPRLPMEWKARRPAMRLSKVAEAGQASVRGNPCTISALSALRHEADRGHDRE